MVMSNPRAELPEDAKFVHPNDAHEHGYYGVVPDENDDYVYTVAGVTEAEAAAKKEDAAKSADSSRTAKKEAGK